MCQARSYEQVHVQFRGHAASFFQGDDSRGTPPVGLLQICWRVLARVHFPHSERHAAQLTLSSHWRAASGKWALSHAIVKKMNVKLVANAHEASMELTSSTSTRGQGLVLPSVEQRLTCNCGCGCGFSTP